MVVAQRMPVVEIAERVVELLASLLAARLEEALRGDRTQSDAYASLKGRTWDVVVDTANSVPWTREACAALVTPPP